MKHITKVDRAAAIPGFGMIGLTFFHPFGIFQTSCLIW